MCCSDISDVTAKNLIKRLKTEPPKESYENPKLPGGPVRKFELDLMNHIFMFGIDLPGSKHNLYGHLQYYSSFFIDMFFGNYTEAMESIYSLTDEELKRVLSKREGYCKFSPIFAPILRNQLIFIMDNSPFYTPTEKQKIKMLYSGNNENRHLEILKKLLKLGADTAVYDINGFTPLHYALFHTRHCQQYVQVLLKYGAPTNFESRTGARPLDEIIEPTYEVDFRVIEMLIDHKAKSAKKSTVNEIRSSVEANASRALAIKVREALPRDKNECEKCCQPAQDKCATCGLVVYCSINCQNLDWNFHRAICRNPKKE